MKKIYLLLIVVVITAVSMAQTATIYKFSATTVPVLDGEIDASWDIIDAIEPDAQAPENPMDADYNKVEVKMGYTDEALYVLFDVEDDEFCPPLISEFADWQSDRAEIFLDINTDNLDDGVGASYDDPVNYGPWKGHYQFTTPYPTVDNSAPDSEGDTIVTGAEAWPKYVPFDYAYTLDLDNDAWIFEMVIPFTSLTIDTLDGVFQDPAIQFEPTADLTFGFEISMVDVDIDQDGLDEGNPQRKFQRWANIDAWTDMDGAGLVTISEDIISTTKDNQVEVVSIYPSPAANFISIRLAQTADIQIVNMVGQVIKEVDHVNPGESVDISDLNNGLYFIRAKDLDVIGKFVKE